MSKQFLIKSTNVEKKALDIISEKLRELELMLKLSGKISKAQKQKILKRVALIIKEA
jgi:hypothetical protein